MTESPAGGASGPEVDHAASAASLLAELAKIEAPLTRRFPLAPLFAATTALCDAATAVAQRAPGASPDAAARASAALMRASRALVPADYTAGDRFLHPHALPMPDWATLQPIRDLAATAPGSDAEKFAAVDALRARNRVAYAVREAQAAIDDALAVLA